MSGHSHFKTVKATKEADAVKRGKAFAKVGKVIAIAAKEGPDPITNSKLRVAIEQAKIVNMPKENIERAIKHGTGELAGESLEEVVFEGFGPGGIAVIVEGITDNKNRTLGDIKQILGQHNGKLAGEGAVKWMFERKGCIVVDLKLQSEGWENKEKLETMAIEAGADDIYWQEDNLDIYTKPEDLENVKKSLEAKEIKIEASFLGWVPKDTVAIDERAKNDCQKLFEALDENDSVQEIYSNTKD
ncbi:YebC/PmpR family DNA-binding transcriptional regulator [Patescibacteria group bacterium]|nr:YebC/PmpR family DNA-binding transcriptional regulator [Patescibacteria group bacterium]